MEPEISQQMKFCVQLFLSAICLLVPKQNFAQLAQQLSFEELKEHPIALTPDNILRLQQFDLLDSIQAHTLTDLIVANHFKTFHQLQGLACFDSTEVSQLASIAYIEAAVLVFQKTNFTDLNNYNGTFIIRLSFPAFTWLDRELDTTTHDYIGNEFALQQKLQIQCNDQLKFTLNSAKDRGESLGINNKQFGQDFLTTTLFYTAKTPISKLAIGAYQFQWGQGLQLWTSRAMGRSIDILQSVRIAQGLKSYNGADEQRYLKGLAFQWNDASHEIYGICSRKLIDVPSVQDSLALQYGSNATSGLHRTPLELQRKKQILESILGVAWQNKNTAVQMGSMLLYQRYSASSHTDSLGFLFLKYSTPFLLSAGFHLKGNFRQSYCFLELVQVYFDKQHLLRSNAAILGALLHLHPKIQMGVHLRYYGLYYRAFYEQGFHAKNLANNEQGIFLNITCQVRKKIKWQTYIDQYEINYLTATSFPHAQTLFRTQFIYTHHKMAQLQFSYQKAFDQQTGLLSLEGVAAFKRQWTFNAGAQMSSAVHSKKAHSIFFTMQYHQLGNPWRINLHLGSFMVPSPMNPHYQMNYHIGFGTATLQLTGQGYFLQTTTEYKLNQKISFGIRVLWLNKTAVFEADQQTFLYQSMRQNLQFDLQLKYQF